MTEETIAHVQGVVAEKGTDAWWQLPLEALLPEGLRDQAHRLQKGEDTMVRRSRRCLLLGFDIGLSAVRVPNAKRDSADAVACWHVTKAGVLCEWFVQSGPKHVCPAALLHVQGGMTVDSMQLCSCDAACLSHRAQSFAIHTCRTCGSTAAPAGRGAWTRTRRWGCRRTCTWRAPTSTEGGAPRCAAQCLALQTPSRCRAAELCAIAPTGASRSSGHCHMLDVQKLSWLIAHPR
jgi:hypothetical protein